MFIGAAINSFFPSLLKLGGFTTPLAKGSGALVGAFLFVIGGTILPLLVGMILANIFPAVKKILNDGMNASIVVVGFALGCTMNFKQIFVGGASGILLGIIVTLVGGIITIGADKLTGGSGVAGAAMATPAVLSAVDSSYKAIEATTTAQITAAVVVTAILTPILTAWIAKRNKKKLATVSQVND